MFFWLKFCDTSFLALVNYLIEATLLNFKKLSVKPMTRKAMQKYLDLDECFESCLISTHDDSHLWRKCLSHVNCTYLEKPAMQNLVFGLSKLSFSKNASCDVCVLSKHSKTSSKTKNVISTCFPLQLLYLDLFGPSRVMSLDF